MRYAAISAVNLAILLTGVALGIFVAPRIERTARANPSEIEQLPQATALSQLGIKQTAVTPTMTAGTIAIYLALAHHIQSDELVVNGYDLLKLHNAELQLLSRLIPAIEVQKAIDDSKSKELFTIPPQTTK